MKITALIARLRPRISAPRRPLDLRDETTVRDWADLPVYHPRAN
jgi:hypothetical protein